MNILLYKDGISVYMFEGDVSDGTCWKPIKGSVVRCHGYKELTDSTNWKSEPYREFPTSSCKTASISWRRLYHKLKTV